MFPIMFSVLSFLFFPHARGQSSIQDLHWCAEECLKRPMNLPTSVPIVLKEKIFSGGNCPIYSESGVRNCTSLSAARDVVVIEGGSYFLGPGEASWFGAQKFCRRGGWLPGVVTSAAFEKEMLRQWQARLDTSDLWSGVNSFASKGATYSNSVTGKIQSDLRYEKGTADKSCILYSDWKSGRISGKPENCAKRARFFCQLQPSCPTTFESCNAQNIQEVYNPTCSAVLASTSIMASSCSAPTCPLSNSCADRVQPNVKVFEPAVPLPFGQLVQSCGKNYFFARDFYPFNMSIDFCCSMGMKLVSFESQTELKCVSDAIIKLDAKDAGSRWWTSATDAGCPGKMAWCGTGDPFSESDLGPLEGFKGPQGRCVVVKNGTRATMSAVTCEEFNRPLCEGEFEPRRIFYNTRCPRVRCKLAMDALSIKAENHLFPADPPKGVGFFSNVDSRNFFVGRSQVNWTDAQARCCSLGMKLISITGPEVLERIVKLMQNKINDDNNYFGSKVTADKLTFWTAGYEWDKNKFSWCHSGDRMPNFNSWTGVNIQLKSGGDGGNCIVTEVGTSVTKNITLANCASKQHFICEIFNKDDDDQDDKCMGQCFYSGSPEEFKFASRADLKPLDPPKGKVVFDACKRHLFVARDSSSFFGQQAKICHSFGMRPLYMETLEDWNCVLTALGNQFDFGSTIVTYHFPLSDFGCPGKLVWCGRGKPMNSTFISLWPNYVDRKDNKSYPCFGASYNKSATPRIQLSREVCDSPDHRRKVICEVPA